MKIYDMQVNHLNNPLGFYMKRTVFGWKVEDAEGKRQRAARIVVAEDEAMTRILADTGYDSKADSLGTEVSLQLKPRTRYYWRVAVQTEALLEEGSYEEAVSETAWFETAKREEAWNAEWIGCDSREKRHPFFEKRIQPAGKVAKARLYLCGLGLYEAYFQADGAAEEQTCVSGLDSGMVRLGEEYLTPYCSDYNRWVQYQTLDVTGIVNRAGTLSVLLGNGWYKGRFGFQARGDVGFYGDSWKLLAELRLTYEDGSEEVIGTDESWSVRRSKILFSNLYDGEHVDELLPELPLERAVCCQPPKGRLMERMNTPVTVHETFAPVSLLTTPAGEQVFDMGQEFTGLFRLRVKEPAGTLIRIQTGEMLQQGNFYNDNLRSAKSEYLYTCDGRETVILPHFTFYGYRYVKVTGVADLKQEDFTGLAFYSDVRDRGWLHTGHELVNKLLSNIRWGLKDNFVDVPTDCPQRDERMGWTGDAQVFSPTATYLTDTYAFYAKYLQDMWEEQQDAEGKVPDVVPSFGVDSCACVWGDAACIIPWNLYLFYGDAHILEDQYPSMKAWVDYVRREDGDNHGWRYRFHYGDWLALDNPAGGVDQVMGGTDEEFIANVYYAAMAGLVSKAAAVLGKTEDAAEYERLSKEQFALVKKEYYSATGRCCIKTQTALLLTLKYQLSHNEELTRRQLRRLFEISGDKLKTGFVGTPLLCDVLTENGFGDLAFTLLLNEEYPGWLREVKLGATTVWERWNSLDEEGNFSSTGMNSLNHYAYGSIAEWMFRHVAGIGQAEGDTGFRRAVIKPLLNWQLREMSGAYDSPAGRYESEWKLTDPSHVTLRVRVPFGCEAKLFLPLAPDSVFGESGNPMFRRVQEGACILEPGEYTVSYELTRSLKPEYSIDTTLRELSANREIAKALLEAGVDLSELPKQCGDMSFRETVETYKVTEAKEILEKVSGILAGTAKNFLHQ